MEKKLNILQVVPYFYPAWAYGGIPRVAYELSKELVKKGHSVTVCTTDVFDKTHRCNTSGKNTVVDGIKVCYFKNISNSLAYNFQVFLPLGLIKFIQHNITAFDVIHLHGHRNLLNNVVHHYAKKAGKPYILTGHGTVLRIERRIWQKVIFDKICGEQILRDAAHFIAVSRNEVQQYEKMGIAKDKTTVIYNGIDATMYESLPKKDDFRKKYDLMGKRIILYLGKITPRKGLDFLTRAFATLNRSDSVLVIAGNDMGFKDRVIEIIKEEAVAEKVIFTGLLVGDEKLSAYQDADVVVYPAVHEIFGLVPFEAIMCGTPVIVTDDCGCGEIIGTEKIGYTVPYNNVREFAEKIHSVLDNKDSAIDLVVRGKRFIADNLNWQLIGEKHINVYKDVINESLLH